MLFVGLDNMASESLVWQVLQCACIIFLKVFESLV